MAATEPSQVKAFRTTHLSSFAGTVRRLRVDSGRSRVDSEEHEAVVCLDACRLSEQGTGTLAEVLTGEGIGSKERKVMYSYARNASVPCIRLAVALRACNGPTLLTVEGQAGG